MTIVRHTAAAKTAHTSGYFSFFDECVPKQTRFSTFEIAVSYLNDTTRYSNERWPVTGGRDGDAETRTFSPLFPWTIGKSFPVTALTYAKTINTKRRSSFTTDVDYFFFFFYFKLNTIYVRNKRRPRPTSFPACDSPFQRPAKRKSRCDAHAPTNLRGNICNAITSGLLQRK